MGTLLSSLPDAQSGVCRDAFVSVPSQFLAQVGLGLWQELWGSGVMLKTNAMCIYRCVIVYIWKEKPHHRQLCAGRVREEWDTHSEYVQLPKSLVGSDNLCRVSHCRGRNDPAAFSASAFIFFISCKLGLINCSWICSCVQRGKIVSLPGPTFLFFPFLPAVSSGPGVSFSALVLFRLQLCSVSLSHSYFLSYKNEYVVYMNYCACLSS